MTPIEEFVHCALRIDAIRAEIGRAQTRIKVYENLKRQALADVPEAEKHRAHAAVVEARRSRR